MTPIGWTLRDTYVRHAVLETASGFVIERGLLQIDSLYSIQETDGVYIERGVTWVDPILGRRLVVIGRGDNVPDEEPGETYTVRTRAGTERWHFGEAATGFIERCLEEWKSQGERADSSAPGAG